MTAAWLAAILLVAAFFRSLGPFLQHSTGDSLHYVALAMKLQTAGFHGYNLRGVALHTRSLDGGSTPHVLQVGPSPASDPDGDLLRRLRSENLGYYDEPLHHMPYGYPALLAATGWLTGHSARDGWELVNVCFNPWDLFRSCPLILAAVQWRWILPSLLCSLGVVLATWWLGQKWFSPSAGLWGAFLMAVHPVDILSAQRIWADDALALFCLLALLAGWSALERACLRRALVAGVLLGLAFLNKPSVLFIGPAVAVAEAVRWRLARGTLPVFPGRLVLACAAGLLLAVGHWLVGEWSLCGTILHDPPEKVALLDNPWQQVLSRRPFPPLIYTAGLMALSPALVGGWFCIRDRRVGWLLLVAGVFAVEVMLIGGREYRYLLPVLPLLSIAAGYALSRVPPRWRALPAVLAVGQIAWSLYLANGYAWRNWGEIMVPF